MYKFFEKLVNAFPIEEKYNKVLPNTIIKFVYQCADGVKKWIALYAILSAFIGLFHTYLFYILGNVISWLSKTDSKTFLLQEKNKLIIMLIVIAGSVFVATLLTIVKHQVLAGTLPMRLRWRFHNWLLNQSLSFYQDEFAGRISAKVMQTALSVRSLCFKLVDSQVYIIISFISMYVLLSSSNLLLSIPFLIWIIIYTIMVIYFVPRLYKVSNEQAATRSLMTGRITDAYTNIMTVKLFSHAGREMNYAKESMQEFLQVVNKQMRLISTFEIINSILFVLLLISASYLSIVLWINGTIDVGIISMNAAIIIRVMLMSEWVLFEAVELFEDIGSIKDGLNTITQQQTIKDKKTAKILEIDKGQIEFSDVGYSHSKHEKLFDHFNLSVKAGEKIGLVGKSGAGKSTLVNLLLRFYDLDAGAIYIDKQNIADVTQVSLRASIGMVTQDTSLLHRTIKENILYGNPHATETEMVNAAKKADAHNFIQMLKDSFGNTGYDVQVGERGVKLSGGQRQRVAIAKVMLKNAPILLLDEATSALDSEIEKIIQSNLEELMKDKTVIAIAHRLSTIAKMDRLVVIDQGKIVEQGTHQELLTINGLYARLWQHQSGGFLGNTND